MGLFGKNKNKVKETHEPKQKGKSKEKRQPEVKAPVEPIIEEEQPIWNLFGRNGSVIKELNLIQLRSFANEETSTFIFTDSSKVHKDKAAVQSARVYFLHKFEKDGAAYKAKCKAILDEIKTKGMDDVKTEIEIGRHYALDLVIDGQLSFIDFIKFYQELGGKTTELDRKYLAILVKLRAVLLEVGVEEEDFLNAYKAAIKAGYAVKHPYEEEIFNELQGILNKLNEDYEFDDELWNYLKVALTTGQNIKVVEEPEQPMESPAEEVAEPAGSPLDFEDEPPLYQPEEDNMEDMGNAFGEDLGALASPADFEEPPMYKPEVEVKTPVAVVEPIEVEEDAQKSITILLKTTPAMQFVFLSQSFKKLISELISSSEIKLNSDNITVILGDLEYEEFDLTRETFDEFVANVSELKDDLNGVFFTPALEKLEGSLERNKVYVVVYDYIADKTNAAKALTRIKEKATELNSTLVTICVDCPGSAKVKEALIDGVNHVYLDKDLAYDTLKLTNVMSKMIY